MGIAQPKLSAAWHVDRACGRNATVLFILATGVTFVIMLRGIDLSIQSMASLASVIVALTVTRLGYGSFLLAIAIGAIAGLLSRIVHVRLKIPSFIATLAMGGVLFSAALVISKERSITLDETGGAPIKRGSPARRLACRNVIFIGLLVLAAAHVVQAHTPGSAVTVQRSERESLRLMHLASRSGRQKDLRLCAFGGVRGGGGCRPCGPRLLAVRPLWLLEALVAIDSGRCRRGTAITGGVGSIWRTLVGALIISVVRIGMTFLGVNIFAQNLVFGAVLIGAAAITIDRTKIPIVK